jgi:tetratricopeptide (TPR) repeat protein
MRTSSEILLAITITLIACLLISCSRDERSRYAVLMESGQASFDKGKFGDAVNAWDNALKLAPDNPDLLFLLAGAHQRLAQFDLSTQLLRRAVEKKYKPVDAYFMVAQNDILVGNFEAAQDVCTKLESMMPKDYRLVILKGDISSFMGRYREGESFYQQAIALDSRRSDAYFKLAANLLAQEKVAAADTYYRQAVDTGDRSAVQYWLHRAEYLALKGDAENAEAAIKHALEIQPNDLFIKLKIAQMLLTFKKYDALLDFLGEPDDLTTENPAVQKIIVEAMINTGQLERAQAILQHHRLSGDSEWLLLFGKYKLVRGAFTDAISHLERALEKSKNDPNAYYLLALAYIAADKINLASQTLIHLLTIFPGMIDAELALADVYYVKKDYDLSVDYLESVLRKTPENFRAYLMLGNCLLATGRYGDAELNFQKALSLDARSVPARYYLALTNESAGRSAEAIGLYQSIVEKTPEMADAGLRLSNLLIRENRVKEAFGIFSALVETHPDNGYLKFILASIYQSSQDIENANHYYKLAVSDQPGLIEGYKRLADLQADSTAKIAIIRDALEKVPNSIDLQMILVNLYFETTDLDSALALMGRVYSLNPQNMAAANNLSWLYLENGTNLAKAYELARSAFESEPDNPHYAHTLGWAYHKKGINKQAEWYLNESLRLLSEHPQKITGSRCFKGIFSYHLGLTLMETKQDKEAKERLLLAIDAGLPDRYEKHAREILGN